MSLVNGLRALPREAEWVEFKIGYAEPLLVGEYVSALMNAAALVGKAFACLVWEVCSEEHTVVGMGVDPHTGAADRHATGRMGEEDLSRQDRSDLGGLSLSDH